MKTCRLCNRTSKFVITSRAIGDVCGFGNGNTDLDSHKNLRECVKIRRALDLSALDALT